MGTFLHAVGVFFDHLASVALGALALAVVCHLAKMACRSRAWRNIVAAAYPAAEVRWRGIACAYAAGVGVNGLVPARGGDLVRLYLARRAVPGSSYPTLVSTLAVETIVDAAFSLALLAWAIEQGVLPGLDVVPRLAAFDLKWVVGHPLAAAGIAAGILLALAWLAWRASRHVVSFGRRLWQGLAVLGDGRRYLRSVVTWQVADWCFRILTLVFFLRAFGIGVGLRPLDDLANSLTVQVTQSVSALVPLTPSGIGTEQALVVYAFAGDVSTTALLSFSVGMNIVLIATNTLVGFGAILLALGTLRWRRHMAREAAIPGETPGRAALPVRAGDSASLPAVSAGPGRGPRV